MYVTCVNSTRFAVIQALRKRFNNRGFELLLSCWRSGVPEVAAIKHRWTSVWLDIRVPFQSYGSRQLCSVIANRCTHDA